MSPRGGRRRLFQDRGVDEDVAREIRSHLDLRERELVEEGWEPGEARQEALRAFGDVDAVAGACTEITRSHHRAVRRAEMFEAVGQDVRYGVRSLVSSPGFSLVALLTLALGIGANTAIFSVVEGVLLEPLPYEEPEELVWISEVNQRGGPMSVAWANFVDWREQAPGMEALSAFGLSTPTVLGGAEPVQVPGATVSQDFWSVFRVSTLAGRLTLPEDHREGAAPVVVVSRSMARDILGSADPGAVVGRVIRLQGTPFEIVGVVATEFDFPGGAQHWSAVERTPQGDSRTSHNWAVVGRLGDGTIETVEPALDAFQARLMEGVSTDDLAYMAAEVRMVPLREELVGDIRQPLLILFGAAAFVLLVACTNLASTLLARGTVRSREFAVRSALGGSRRRLVRQLLTESVVLSLAGASAGVALAAGSLRLLRSLGEGAVPRLDGVSIDATVLGFTLLVALITALAFGLLPALRNAEGAQANVLRASGRGQAGGRRRTWDVLVASEVALALMLLVGSGLLIRSLAAVLDEDAGFDASDVALLPVSLGAERYPSLDDHVRFWDGALERAGQVPGVTAVGVLSNRPLSSFPNGQVALDGDPSKYGDAGYMVASAGAFDALDIPLLRGRLFESTDGPDAPHVVVVSESFADTYWPGEDPVGRQVSGGGMDNYWDADPPVFGTVVGVVGDVRYRALERVAEPTVYWHYRQRPARLRFGGFLMAESGTGAPSLVAPQLGRVVRDADPEIPIRLGYMRDVVVDSVGDRRFMLFVLGGFAALAMILAGVGIYGVVSYTVARRTREMGVRLALGSPRESVLGLVLKGALRPVVFGLAAGVAGGLALSCILGGFLYQVDANDPVTFAGVTLALLLVGVAASVLPALRGTKVDPMIAMRAE
ncbi:MAG: ABC transporter permease [Longimicrobiales bacterium]